jgi:hypothetical protein
MKYAKKTGLIFVIFVLGALAAAVAFDLRNTDVLEQFLKGNANYTGQGYLIAEELPPYEVDEPNSTNTYIRYQSGTGNVYIKRIFVHSTVTRYEKATAAWSSRTTATYTPINDS